VKSVRAAVLAAPYPDAPPPSHPAARARGHLSPYRLHHVATPK